MINIVFEVESIEVCSFANCEDCKRASASPFCGFCGIRCMPTVLQGYKFLTDSKKLFVGLESEEGRSFPREQMDDLEEKLNPYYRQHLKIPKIYSGGMLKELTPDEVLQIF